MASANLSLVQIPVHISFNHLASIHQAFLFKIFGFEKNGDKKKKKNSLKNIKFFYILFKFSIIRKFFPKKYWSVKWLSKRRLFTHLNFQCSSFFYFMCGIKKNVYQYSGAFNFKNLKTIYKINSKKYNSKTH